MANGDIIFSPSAVTLCVLETIHFQLGRNRDSSFFVFCSFTKEVQIIFIGRLFEKWSRYEAAIQSFSFVWQPKARSLRMVLNGNTLRCISEPNS